MMTFKDLKKLVELPSYKEQRVPTVKALEVSGVPVVAEKILENHGSISVYQNGYVIYRAHKRVTVFSLRNCVHYKYDALEGAGHHIEEEEFDEYEWHIRLVLEGEDRIFMNYEIIQGKWMPSREDREYKEEILEGVDDAVSTLERMISEEGVEELLSTLTDLQRKVVHIHLFHAGLSQSNYWKYENHTSGGMKNELPGVPKSNGSNTEKINKTDNSETDLIYPAELQEEEQYRRYFKEALELEILEQGYPADKAVLYEILELLVETVTSRKKFLRICGEEKPKEVVKSRLMKLDSSHIQYILECLKENSTQIRNIKQYLLATLYNAPVTVDSYYSAQVRHEFGWGSRVDKN